VLVIRPNYDKATSFTHAWAQLIVDARPGVEDIADTNVTPGVVRSALPNQTSIAFYGHGTAIALLGHHDAPVISVVDAIAGRLRGKVILAVACNSAQFLGLGWIAARTGTKAYLGYTRKFRFLAGGASTFGEVANAPLLRMILRGATAGDALDFGRNTYREAIEYYVGGRGRFHPSRPGIVARLGWNLNSFVLRGDEKMTLS
jgi:hypothetical protein